jgi:hypothetical protein
LQKLRGNGVRQSQKAASVVGRDLDIGVTYYDFDFFRLNASLLKALLGVTRDLELLHLARSIRYGARLNSTTNRMHGLNWQKFWQFGMVFLAIDLSGSGSN